MKTFLAFIGFLFLMVTFGIGVMVWKVRRRMNAIRQAMEDNMNDEAFQRMANKHYYRDKRDEGPQFEEGYFSSARKKGGQQQKQQRRTTQTQNGVTIIDDRDPSVAQRKIFTHDEGEYVDFKEE